MNRRGFLSFLVMALMILCLSPVEAKGGKPLDDALTPFGKKINVTHSGSNDRVSVFVTKGFFFPKPNYTGDVTVGQNPFELAFVP